ncbi:ribosome small subunit-dependent GTPase A [Halobacillus sp. Marseille-Q1614]|uniref:ribosome small subunit-dependent GTPase A n=1 Tax=Halobacillus sp. Marseille-Q1614 TaxID=2709134 RepID=UPI0020C4EFBC|nr:ribosome small subunit-dependent GTPase A [Halobacillus sp. Marseille-Q1614]
MKNSEQLIINEEKRVGRVARSASDQFLIWGEDKVYQAQAAGKLRYSSTLWPATGDWVVYEPYDEVKAIIHQVLERKTVLSRKEAGTRHQEQVIAANIHTVFIITSLTDELNIPRLERYVTQVYDSGASPVIICTKKDLCDDPAELVWRVENHIPAVPVYTVSSISGEGMDAIIERLDENETIAFVGSSGVGKSTLINRLLGRDLQETKQVREQDGKGRHTTTHREMFKLPNGTIVIDTPGIRELQLWGDASSLEGAFSDIEEKAASCKFRDCRHEQEPGCAVQKAINEGMIPSERLRNYKKLLRELERLDLKDKYGTHRTNRLLHSPNTKLY